MKNSFLLWTGLVALVLGACSNSVEPAGGNQTPADETPAPEPPVNEAPTVAVSKPDTAMTMSRGGTVEVNYVDNDPDDVAETSVFADADGDPATTADRIPISVSMPERDGVGETVPWDTMGVPLGTYSIVVVTDDGVNAPATAVAAGTVTLENVSFARKAVGSSHESANDIAVFPDGSLAVAAGWESPLTLGQGEANETTLPSSQGAQDPLVARYNADGSFAWAWWFQAPAWTSAAHIVGFDDGSCVVQGSFASNSITIAGKHFDTSGTDVFVVKLDRDGNEVWAQRMGSPDGPNASGMAALADGSVVVVGTFRGETTWDPGGPNESFITPDNGDPFMVKYTAAGELAWIKTATGTEWESAQRVAVYADGSFVVTGGFGSQIRLGIGEANDTTLTATTGDAAYIARYNADGTLARARVLWDTGDASVGGLASYPDGSFIIAGEFYGTVTFGAGDPNETTRTVSQWTSFNARHNADGTLAWLRTTGTDGGGSGLAPLADGGFLVVDSFEDTITLGAGEPSETTFTSTDADRDLYVARYYADGTLAWARQTSGIDSESARGIGVCPDGSFAIAGGFRIEINFSSGAVILTGESESNTDLFVARFNADGDF
jgi:hypothetical protein